MRRKLMLDLQEGKTALMSFQQAIGGSLSRSERVGQEMDDDDEPLQIPRSGNTVVTVPALEEIVVPSALTQLPSSLPPPLPPSLPTSPTTPQVIFGPRKVCDGEKIKRAWLPSLRYRNPS